VSDQDIATLILSEHELFRREFARLETLGGDDLREGWDRLAELLEVHAAGEEAVFYPHVVRQLPEGDDETEHALHDHNEIRAAAQAVTGQEPGSDAWWEAVRHTQEVNGDHMAEEEHDILGDFKERIGQEQRDELGLAWLQFHEDHDRAAGLSGEPEDVEAYVEAAKDGQLPQETEAREALEQAMQE
jgi:Hemerythrin HHE cation binding domain